MLVLAMEFSRGAHRPARREPIQSGRADAGRARGRRTWRRHRRRSDGCRSLKTEQ